MSSKPGPRPKSSTSTNPLYKPTSPGLGKTKLPSKAAVSRAVSSEATPANVAAVILSATGQNPTSRRVRQTTPAGIKTIKEVPKGLAANAAAKKIIDAKLIAIKAKERVSERYTWWLAHEGTTKGGPGFMHPDIPKGTATTMFKEAVDRHFGDHVSLEFRARYSKFQEDEINRQSIQRALREKLLALMTGKQIEPSLLSKSIWGEMIKAAKANKGRGKGLRDAWTGEATDIEEAFLAQEMFPLTTLSRHYEISSLDALPCGQPLREDQGYSETSLGVRENLVKLAELFIKKGWLTEDLKEPFLAWCRENNVQYNPGEANDIESEHTVPPICLAQFYAGIATLYSKEYISSLPEPEQTIFRETAAANMKAASSLGNRLKLQERIGYSLKGREGEPYNSLRGNMGPALKINRERITKFLTDLWPLQRRRGTVANGDSGTDLTINGVTQRYPNHLQALIAMLEKFRKAKTPDRAEVNAATWFAVAQEHVESLFQGILSRMRAVETLAEELIIPIPNPAAPAGPPVSLKFPIGTNFGDMIYRVLQAYSVTMPGLTPSKLAELSIDITAATPEQKKNIRLNLITYFDVLPPEIRRIIENADGRAKAFVFSMISSNGTRDKAERYEASLSRELSPEEFGLTPQELQTLLGVEQTRANITVVTGEGPAEITVPLPPLFTGPQAPQLTAILESVQADIEEGVEEVKAEEGPTLIDTLQELAKSAGLEILGPEIGEGGVKAYQLRDISTLQIATDSYGAPIRYAASDLAGAILTTRNSRARAAAAGPAFIMEQIQQPVAANAAIAAGAAGAGPKYMYIIKNTVTGQQVLPLLFNYKEANRFFQALLADPRELLRIRDHLEAKYSHNAGTGSAAKGGRHPSKKSRRSKRNGTKHTQYKKQSKRVGRVLSRKLNGHHLHRSHRKPAAKSRRYTQRRKSNK